MPDVKKEKLTKDEYRIILGTFQDNEFTWHEVDAFDNLHDAYKQFKKYVNSQLKYTDEELIKVWDTGRLDIELMKGSKLLNWVGIYAREAEQLSKKEHEEAEEADSKKSDKED